MADERFDEVNDLIDEAMAEVGAERPSPDFVARLRQEAERAPRRTPGAWRAQAIAAAAAIVLTVFGARVFDRSASFVNPVAVPQRDVALAAEPGGAGAPAALPWTRPSMARPKRIARHPADAVLVPRREREAVDRLFASLRAGSPGVVIALGRLGAGGGADDVASAIAPIRIEPVAVPAMPASTPVFDR